MATVKFVEKLFGDQNKKKLKNLQKDVDAINGFEASIQALTDDQLRKKTAEFRKRLQEGADLDSVKHEAFAVVREGARRTLGQRHYDVQMIGGLVMNGGGIAEMRTGEGKTLSGTTAIYLNALTGNGVHVVTVNDYLARRDADWMGQVYHFLGLSVGCIQANNTAFVYDADIEAVRRPEAGEAVAEQEDATTEEVSTEGDGYEALIAADMAHLRKVHRAEAYQADITYGTNNEFGFDYLRDNMVRNIEEKVQRDLHFALIDEVDSILIDEARTPLIISAPAAGSTKEYYQFAQLVQQLQEDTHYNVDEKMRSATLTDEGIATLEKALGVDNIYTDKGIRTVHHIEQALKAKTLFARDKDYVVRDGEVVIIDEFTGRMMDGRRYSEGLHQAIEAKEGVEIKEESRTLATITLQNYFRMYEKLSGMTGTAESESEEFFKIYGLDVVVIPTHREIQRVDRADRVYKNAKGKYEALIAHIKEVHENGQPILVGTISIEQNELLSKLLKQANIPHNILNAKHHEQEAAIIAQAGKLGAVTVATNMAGRGVDIILGGNPVDIEEARKVRELGGLAVIGTERHEARRIDNQLRGRAGRQGDPGSSTFFVSMDDELMRVFGSDRMKNFMDRLGVPDDMPIENKMVSRSIESAQKKVEARNFDIRKHLVEYDDVINKHRDTIYRRRNEVLEMNAEELRAHILELVDAEIESIVSFHTNQQVMDEVTGELEEGEWNIREICETMSTIFSLDVETCVADVQAVAAGNENKLDDVESRTKLIEYFYEKAVARYHEMIDSVHNDEAVFQVERNFVLRATDMLWIEHIDQMSFLRDSIGLRGYGQRDPLVEYKKEGYQMFQELLGSIQKEIVYNVFRIGDAKIIHNHVVNESSAEAENDGALPDKVEYSAPLKEMEKQGARQQGKPFVAERKGEDGEKIGRNDPCFCGSGKKYKKCHGQNS